MKLFDQHVHSNYSFDSVELFENYIKKAIELGFDFFVTTEHMDLNYLPYKPSIFDIQKQHQFIDKIQNKYPEIKILKGIEIGYGIEIIDDIKEILKNNNFDIVNLSLHVLNGLDYYNPELIKSIGVTRMLDSYFKAYKELVNSGLDFDVCCHIDYAFKSAYLDNRTLKISSYEKELTEILNDIIKNDKTLEINTKVESVINDEHTLYLLKLYKKLGGKNLTLSSDAHSLDRYCDGFDHYKILIKEAGFDHLCYFVKRKRYNLEI